MTKALLTISILIAAVGGGYFWYANRSVEPMETLFSAEVQKKLDEYQKINELSPNLSVFDDKLFQVLRPIERVSTASATSTVRRGRDNPFIPF